MTRTGLSRLGMLVVWTLVVAVMPANAAPINQLPYGSLSGTGLIDFEGVAAAPFPGTSIDGVLDLGGASFGERFDGQTLGISGNFDVLSGLPTGSPTLLAGGPNENLVAVNAGGVGIAGLGPLGYPDLGANGEGALAILFDVDTAEFGLEIRGADMGTAILTFFRRDGTLIDVVSLAAVSSGFYGFLRESGAVDIAGLTITNDDPGGFGVDNIRFQQPIPEPASFVLVGLGLVATRIAGRRRTRSRRLGIDERRQGKRT